MNELEALVLLTTIPYLGSVKIRLLIQSYGTAAEALKADRQSLSTLPGFGPKILKSWEECLKNESWRNNLKLAGEHEAYLVPYTDPRYPKRLLEIVDYPLILYVRGVLTKEDQRCLAIVGTRQATIYGLEMARQLSRELAQAGFTIVSGLARGVDTAAHLGALESPLGRTISVIGSGLCQIYPKENIPLAEKMSERGAVISEFPMMTAPDRRLFPQRNRLVSGMTMGTILIEAPQSSGAMITVEKALEQGRPVFALPGRVDQETFHGNHALIKTNKAGLIENSGDVLTYFGQLFPVAAPRADCASQPLEKEEGQLMRLLPTEELSIEEIVNRVQWPIAKLNVILMSLVLKKALKEYPGKIYKKTKVIL